MISYHPMTDFPGPLYAAVSHSLVRTRALYQGIGSGASYQSKKWGG